jgi:hypothetical protein
MWSVSASLIGGVKLGIEFPTVPEDISVFVVVDLIVLRLTFLKYTDEEVY